MRHAVSEEGARLVVRLEGEVDLENSPKAREVLLEAVGGDRAVLVDLSGVTYIDSSGVASLVEAFQVAKRKSIAFALVSVNPAALRVLQLARLDKVFTIHESLPEEPDGDS